MIQAAIFDMDGLLIDSEPFWQKAEVRSFGVVGVSLSPDDLRQTVGLRIDAVVRHWLERRPWDVALHPPTAVGDEIVAGVIKLIESQGAPMPGVVAALELFEGLGLRVALASSSSMRIIEAVLCKLQLSDRFTTVHSAEFEAHGKPDPAVFLSTARDLGISPRHCIALEDSVFGLTAARAAGMRCIMVPDPRLRDDPALADADLVLDSLLDLDAEALRAAVGLGRTG